MNIKPKTSLQTTGQVCRCPNYRCSFVSFLVVWGAGGPRRRTRRSQNKKPFYWGKQDKTQNTPTGRKTRTNSKNKITQANTSSPGELNEKNHHSKQGNQSQGIHRNDPTPVLCQEPFVKGSWWWVYTGVLGLEQGSGVHCQEWGSGVLRWRLHHSTIGRNQLTSWTTTLSCYFKNVKGKKIIFKKAP